MPDLAVDYTDSIYRNGRQCNGRSPKAGFTAEEGRQVSYPVPDKVDALFQRFADEPDTRLHVLTLFFGALALAAGLWYARAGGRRSTLGEHLAHGATVSCEIAVSFRQA